MHRPNFASFSRPTFCLVKFCLSVKLFADDTNLFLHHKNITDLYSKANDNLELL